MSKVVLLHRWKKGYEAFIRKDHSAAFSMFELIKMTFIDKSSIPKEIIMNRILCLLALKNTAHPVEVGSKLLRSELGSFFLFAVGLHQEKVNKELAFSSFKKCLLSLGSSKAKQFPGSCWMLTKFMVLINLAITSASMGNVTEAESYLQKAELFAIDEVSRKRIQQYSTFGLEGAFCIEFPEDLLIAPPEYKVEKTNAPKPVENVQTDTKPIDNESNLTVDDTKPIQDKLQVAVADKNPKKHESTVANYPDNLQALKNALTPDQYDSMRKKVESMLPSPPLNQTEKDSDFVPFYRYLKKFSRNSKQGLKPSLKPSSPIEEDLVAGEFFSEIAHVQIFGIWRPFAVCMDGKVLKLCKENMRSQVDLEIQLDNCRIEPATNFSFRKLHLFKLVIYTDEYIFALDSLSTSLEWIAKIMKAALSIPVRKDLTLLRTGLGRDHFSSTAE